MNNLTVCIVPSREGYHVFDLEGISFQDLVVDGKYNKVLLEQLMRQRAVVETLEGAIKEAMDASVCLNYYNATLKNADDNLQSTEEIFEELTDMGQVSLNNPPNIILLPPLLNEEKDFEEELMRGQF